MAIIRRQVRTVRKGPVSIKLTTTIMTRNPSIKPRKSGR